MRNYLSRSLVWIQLFAVILTVFSFQNRNDAVKKRTNSYFRLHDDRSKVDPDDDERKGFDNIRRRLLLMGGVSGAFAASSALSILPKEASSAPTTTVNVAPQDVIPYSSVRRYKLTKLSNGLQVMLVSDSQAPMASAAISIEGAGQFSDPSDLPGRAHLMEHMVLSYNSKVAFQKSRDFEDWLSDRDGASNAFTAYDTVCFHFTTEEASFSEALERFANLFRLENIEKVCRNSEVLKREIRRVNSELDFNDAYTQEMYLTKAFVNREHPFSRFTAGDTSTLETLPKEAGIDVGERLIDFFKNFYLPSKATLVVVSRQDIVALERFVNSFSTVLSRDPNENKKENIKYPGTFLKGNRLKHIVLFNKAIDRKSEKLTFQWTLNLNYDGMQQNPRGKVTATQVAFVLAQIFSRRGPGSLGYFLLRRGWAPYETGIPRVSVPVDVSNFQIIQLTIPLTQEGMKNRATVVSSFYNSLASMKKDDRVSISRDFLSQSAALAKLHGYTLAQRPPDSIELAIDSRLYGVGLGRPGSGDWYLYPEPGDQTSIKALLSESSSFLEEISDPSSALIIASTGNNAALQSSRGRLPDSVRRREPISGVQFYFEDMLKLPARVESLLLSKVVIDDELSPPVLNPLVPVSRTRNVEPKDTSKARQDSFNTDWILLENRNGDLQLPLPRGPPENVGRALFVIELLSPRPARANVRQAAQGELWKLSFENAAKDVAELGAPGGLAYDISFNKFGLRLVFLGMNRNLPSYCRRICRRLIEHQTNLLDGPEMFSRSITNRAIENAKMARGLSQQRKVRIISNLRRSTAYEAALEGRAFLRSINGAVCFAQGDLSKQEQEILVNDVQSIFESYTKSSKQFPLVLPLKEDLVYKPVWKPRYGSLCAVSGVPLINNACGRVPR